MVTVIFLFKTEINASTNNLHALLFLLYIYSDKYLNNITPSRLSSVVYASDSWLDGEGRALSGAVNFLRDERYYIEKDC